MTIIVLGGSGFLGKSLISKLEEKKLDYKAIFHKKNEHNNNFPYVDILQEGVLDDFISDNDVIINLIGQYHENHTQFFDINLKGGSNILNSAKKKKNIKIILASSITVYGNNSNRPSTEEDLPNPITNYGFVKLLTEKLYQTYSETYGIDVTVLRFSNIFGNTKNIGIISHSLAAIKNNKKLVVYHSGKQIRDFLFIDDAVKGISAVIQLPTKGFEIFNISSSKGIKILDLLKEIEKITSKRIPIELNPQQIDEEILWADNSKAKQVLNYTPNFNIETGLEKTLRDLL